MSSHQPEPLQRPSMAVQTLADLMSKGFPALTVGDLLESLECTPMCITAAGHEEACVCPCDGQYHGAARDLEVHPGWPEERPQHDGAGCHWDRRPDGTWAAAVGDAEAADIEALRSGWGPLTTCRCAPHPVSGQVPTPECERRNLNTQTTGAA